MSHKRYIGNLQVAGMVCTVLAVANMISLPMSLTELSLQDSLYSFFFACLYCIGIAFLLYKLAEKVPGKNIFEISKHLCGKWAGGLLNGLLLVYLFYDLAGLLRLHADFFNSSILLRTPIEFILLVTVMLLAYFGAGSIEDLMRTNDMFVPLYLLLFFILAPFLFLNEIDLTQLLPSLSGGWTKPYQSGILGMGAFGDIIVLGAFMNNVKDPRALYVSLRSGIILSAGIMTLWLLLILTVISPTTASRIIYIGWILVQQIHITDFLDRVDLVVFSTWLPLLLVKMMVLYLSILTGLATYTKDNSYKRLNMITGMLLIMLSIVCFKNVMEVVTFNNYGIFPLTFAIQLIYFGVLFAALWLRRRGRNEIRGTVTPIGHGLWLGFAGCFAAILFGNVFGHLRGGYGIVSVSCYVLFMLLTTVIALNDLRLMQLRAMKQ